MNNRILIFFVPVNPGMEHHSDSDSFHDNHARNGFGGRIGSQVDPSRSNSLMSETSSQPDIHPFFKVSITISPAMRPSIILFFLLRILLVDM